MEEIGIRAQRVCGSDWIHVGYKNLWALVHYLEFGDPLGLLEAIILVLLTKEGGVEVRVQWWVARTSSRGTRFTSKQLLMFC